MQPYRTPQGVTVPRCLRLTAVGTIETSPYGSAFTYGYLGSPAKVGGILLEIVYEQE